MYVSRRRLERITLTSPAANRNHFNRRSGSKCVVWCVEASRWQRRFDFADASLNHLSQWLSQSSGKAPESHVNNLSLSDCEMQGYRGPFTVRGLVSEVGAAEDDVLLSIPLSSCVQDLECTPAFHGSGWNVNMARFLLTELDRANMSPCLGYLRTLPSIPPDLPLLMTAQEISEIQYPQAMEAVERYQMFALDSYDKWQMSDASARIFSRADFSWALHMVQSRSIRLAVKGIRVMVPGIDLLNHGGSSSHGFLALTGSKVEGQQSICFVAKRTIEKGAQVLWSYGDRSNCDFFVYHGFSLPANKDDDVSLFSSVSHLVGWAESRLKLEGVPLDKDGLNDPAALSEALASESNTAASSGHQSASVHAAAAIQGTSSALLVSSNQIAHNLSTRDGDLLSWESEETLEGRASRAFRLDTSITRRLSAYRLHSNDWGSQEEKSLAPELVGTGTKVDVRIIAVLAMLIDRANNVTTADGPTKKLGFESISRLIQLRCRELLDALPTTLAQDEALLLANVSYPSRGTLDFRMGKKRVLVDMIDLFRNFN